MLDTMQLSGELDKLIVDSIDDILKDTVGIRFVPLKGLENAERNTREFNALVNNLQTKLIDSEIKDQKVKWSIPTINITIPDGEYYFNGFDIIQGLTLKGAGKNSTIIHLLNPLKITYKYQQTLANGVGNVTISNIFFYGNHEKTLNCFEPVFNEKTGRFAHLIYSNIYDCSFYGFNEVFKVIGYNNSIYNNTYNWINDVFMIYGYDGTISVGGDWNIYCNSANNIRNFIVSTFSSLIHAHDNWIYQGSGEYIKLMGWNRGSVIENNRLEDTTTNVFIHGGSLVSHEEKVYQKLTNGSGDITGETWQVIDGLDYRFIEPYNTTKNYNILQAIAITVRNNNFHTSSEDTLIIKGGQYITVQDNYSGNYVELKANISDCKGLKYHNNMNITYNPNFYDDYKDWKSIDSFNISKNMSVGTKDCFMNMFYNTSSPKGISFRLNDNKTAYTVMETGGVYFMNNGKVAAITKNSPNTVIQMPCINSQSVVITPRNKATAEWYNTNQSNIYVETGNGNVAITHPNTTLDLLFNVIVM